MSFRFYLLSFLVIASTILAFAVYRVRQALERHAQAKLKSKKGARRTYFYPTRETDGNETD